MHQGFLDADVTVYVKPMLLHAFLCNSWFQVIIQRALCGGRALGSVEGRIDLHVGQVVAGWIHDQGELRDKFRSVISS
ncbi:hypothetical protein D3C84_748890 [compost metagenome]|jgi:hypothetical protein